MSEIAYVSGSGRTPRWFAAGGPPARQEAPTIYGMHGAIAEHYGAQPGQFPSYASTIDHLFGAALGGRVSGAVYVGGRRCLPLG